MIAIFEPGRHRVMHLAVTIAAESFLNSVQRRRQTGLQLAARLAATNG